MQDTTAKVHNFKASGSTRLAPEVADVRASVIVFLVALPLCLGIANASGAPPLSGLIAGIVGGLVVGRLSGSNLSVSGPAAGLTVIVLDGILTLGFARFSAAVVVSGVLQLGMGALGLGRIAQVVPNAVIRGMLAAIGLILVLKQLPHVLGYDVDPEGEMSFTQPDGHNTFSELAYSLDSITLGAVIVSIVSALSLLAWRDYGSVKLTRFAPRELVVVVAGLATGLFVEGTSVGLSAEHRVDLPALDPNRLLELWQRPDFSGLFDLAFLKLALTLALVASLESLLSVEATDQLDPQLRVTPASRELLAQGTGNIISGALGGLPVTAVVVRSFANLQAGGSSRRSTIFHGFWLLLATLFLSQWLSHIPLASLGVMLLAVGYKLTKPSLYRDTFRLGQAQFLPFIATVLSILMTDLLTGTLLGIAFAVVFIVAAQYRAAVFITDDGKNRLVRLTSHVSFLHKAKLRKAFEDMPEGGHIILDGTRARSIDHDVLETIRSFEKRAKQYGVELTIRRNRGSIHDFFREDPIRETE